MEQERLRKEAAQVEQERPRKEAVQAEQERLRKEAVQAEQERLRKEAVEAEQERLRREAAEAEQERLRKEAVEEEQERLRKDAVHAEQERLRKEAVEAEQERLRKEVVDEQERLRKVAVQVEQERLRKEAVQAEQERLRKEAVQKEQERLRKEAVEVEQEKETVPAYTREEVQAHVSAAWRKRAQVQAEERERLTQLLAQAKQQAAALEKSLGDLGGGCGLQDEANRVAKEKPWLDTQLGGEAQERAAEKSLGAEDPRDGQEEGGREARGGREPAMFSRCWLALKLVLHACGVKVLLMSSMKMSTHCKSWIPKTERDIETTSQCKHISSRLLCHHFPLQEGKWGCFNICGRAGHVSACVQQRGKPIY